MPILRKAFPKLAIAKAIPTEAVEQPKFKISFLEPWIKDHNGRKRKLPEAILPTDNPDEDFIRRKRVNGDNIPVASMSTVTSPPILDEDGTPLVGHNMVGGIKEWIVSPSRTAEI